MENRTLKGNDPLRKSLIHAVYSALENIAFEEPEVRPEPVDVGEETVVFALEVVSPYLLHAKIVIPRELAAQLTQTIYRDDEKEVTAGLLDDTVGEFLNTIIGTMMGELTLGERIFEMGLPQKISGEKGSQGKNIRRIYFRIDRHPFYLEISGDVFIAGE
jgi:hypothetical protein